MRSQISVVILAAGLSRRMGEINKLLISIDGVPMIRRAAELYLSLFSSVTVVTGFQAKDIEAALSGLDVKFVFNPGFETGQQSSVQCGLKSLSLTGSLVEEGVLIALGDQPYLTKTYIEKYVEAFLASPKDKVFIPYFNGQRGNPILFPMPIIRHIMATWKTSSYRAFLDSNPDRTVAFLVSTSHFIEDIDTPDDLANSAPRQQIGKSREVKDDV